MELLGAFTRLFETLSVGDGAAARAQLQQQLVIGNEAVLVLVRDRFDLLHEHLPAGIDAELMSVPDDLGHTELALALVHVEDGDAQKPLVGRGVGVAEGQPERRHRSAPGAGAVSSLSPRTHGRRGCGWGSDRRPWG